MILHILCGIPGSGKSTLVSRLNGYVVSTDRIRKFLWNDEGNIKYDAFVFDMAQQIIEYVLGLGQDVIFDATNLKRQNRANFIRLAKKLNAKVYLHWVNCPIQVALKRNASRARKVPVYAIKALHKTFQKPDIAEGVDKIKICSKNLKIIKIITKKVTISR